MKLIETLNRTMKLAMDEGLVGSHEEAQTLFDSFRLRIIVQPGFSSVPAAEAALLTLLNAAPKTFLGGVELTGDLEERCTRAWFSGQPLCDVAQQFGVKVSSSNGDEMPTICIGDCMPVTKNFCLGISLQHAEFVLSPDHAAIGPVENPVEIGVAAASAAINEAFQYIYRKAPLAGQRNIRWKMPGGGQPISNDSIWLIGLGHLGQAFLWTAALAGKNYLPVSIKLSDYDAVTLASLSTCLLVTTKDIGRRKVDAVAEKLNLLGVEVEKDYQRLNLDISGVQSAKELVVVAVDNIGLRRSLDRISAKRILEAGIGNNADTFTRIQVHAFPGSRKARDVWGGDDSQANRVVDISKPAYKALLAKSGDQCGTTLVAGRSVATPFVGAFAGALLRAVAIDSCAGVFAWNYDVTNL